MSGKLELARNLARRALLFRAREMGAETDLRSALVVAPHPDDETLGCGARIARGRQRGAAVSVVVATDGAESHAGVDQSTLRRLRSTELAAATGLLDVQPEDVLELGYPDGSLAEHIPALTADLRRLIDEHRPDDVYVTCSAEVHPDHAAAAQAVHAAVDGLSYSPRVLEYPIWLWSDWPLSRRHSGLTAMREWLRLMISVNVHKVDVSPVRSIKAAAVESYASQLGGTRPGPGGRPGHDRPALPEQLVHRAVLGPELFFSRRVTGGH